MDTSIFLGVFSEGVAPAGCTREGRGNLDSLGVPWGGLVEQRCWWRETKSRDPGAVVGSG